MRRAFLCSCVSRDLQITKERDTDGGCSVDKVLVFSLRTLVYRPAMRLNDDFLFCFCDRVCCVPYCCFFSLVANRSTESYRLEKHVKIQIFLV